MPGANCEYCGCSFMRRPDDGKCPNCGAPLGISSEARPERQGQQVGRSKRTYRHTGLTLMAWIAIVVAVVVCTTVGVFWAVGFVNWAAGAQRSADESWRRQGFVPGLGKDLGVVVNIQMRYSGGQPVYFVKTDNGTSVVLAEDDITCATSRRGLAVSSVPAKGLRLWRYPGYYSRAFAFTYRHIGSSYRVPGHDNRTH